MGYWSLETSKTDTQGNEVELNMDDLGHICELINQGFTSGEINDKEEEEDEAIV